MDTVKRALRAAQLMNVVRLFEDNEVKLVKKLGQDSLGMVWAGVLRKDGVEDVPVAVTVTTSALSELQLTNLLIMAHRQLTSRSERFFATALGVAECEGHISLVLPLCNGSVQSLLDNSHPHGMPVPLALDLTLQVSCWASVPLSWAYTCRSISFRMLLQCCIYADQTMCPSLICVMPRLF